MPGSRPTSRPVRGRGGRGRATIAIKREKLATAGHLISPESKKKSPQFSIEQVIEILEKKSNHDYSYDEVKAMLHTWRNHKQLPTSDIESMSEDDIVTELREVQHDLLFNQDDDDHDFTIDEVVHILKGSGERSFSSLSILDMREMLRVWYKHNKEKCQVANLSNDQIKDTLHDIKLTFHSSNKLKFIEGFDQFDCETDDLLENVQKLGITYTSKNSDIEKFDTQQLAQFIYIKSITPDKFNTLEAVLKEDKQTLISLVKNWRDEQFQKHKFKLDQAQLLESDEEETSDTNNNVQRSDDNFTSKLTHQANIAAPPSHDPIDNDGDVIMTDAEDEDDKEMELSITPSLTEEKLKTISFELMCNIYHKHKQHSNKPIAIQAIQLWTEEHLQSMILKEVAILKASNTQPLPKPSNLKVKTKYSTKTSTQTNLSGEVAQSWRYSMYFTHPTNVQSVAELRSHMMSLFHDLKYFCKDLKLMLWSTDDQNESISDSEHLPQTITSLKKYFDGLRSPVGVQKQYIKVRFSFPITTDRPTFEADAISKLNERGARMFICPVQASNTKIVGWLAYPPNTIDREKWSRAAQELYLQASEPDAIPIKVGLAWRALSGQWDVPQKEKVYAMHPQ